MKLHGSIDDNLRAAIEGAERHRGHPVHPDTRQFWNDVLAQARAEIRTNRPDDVGGAIDDLVAELQSLLAARDQPPRI